MQNRPSGVAFGVIALLLLFEIAPIEAAVFTCASGDDDCLIAAINAANANGETNTIRLAEGTYLVTAPLSSASTLPPITSTLTLVGGGPAATIIDAGSQLAPVVRIEPSGVLLLKGLTVQHGTESGGVGIFNRGAATLENILVTRNGFVGTGGVLNEGTMLIVDSAVRQNHSQLETGGIDNSGTLTILRSAIEQNTGVRAGASIFSTGPLTIIDSIVADNSSGGGFGSIAVVGPSGSSRGELRISRSAILRNRSGRDSGATALSISGAAVVEDTTIAGNFSGTPESPTFGRPVIRLFSGELRLLNATVADNRQNAFDVAGPDGPAPVIFAQGKVELQNTIIARNPGFPAVCSATGNGTVVSLGNNIIDDPADCPITLLPSDHTGDAGLGVFAGEIVPLLRTSPAIDAGNNSACSPFDQRGLPRVDGNGDGEVVCDIGAAEFIDHVVELDITRGKGVFNAHSNQKVTVDVLGTPAFDVQEIDPASIRLGATGYETEPGKSTFKDIDRDGNIDLRLQVRAADLKLDCDSPIIALTAKTVGAETVGGTTPIRTGKCKD